MASAFEHEETDAARRFAQWLRMRLVQGMAERLG